MSLYNLINGMNTAAAVALSPFLPRKATDFPRFRDIFLEAEDYYGDDGDIFIYTRMGGGNRDCWYDGEKDCDCPGCDASRLEGHVQCVDRYDDTYDCTYSTFVWRVSDEDRPDFEALMEGRSADLSDRYKSRLKEMFLSKEDEG